MWPAKPKLSFRDIVDVKNEPCEVVIFRTETGRFYRQCANFAVVNRSEPTWLFESLLRVDVSKRKFGFESVASILISPLDIFYGNEFGLVSETRTNVYSVMHAESQLAVGNW